jgi:hypothetical protein
MIFISKVWAILDEAVKQQSGQIESPQGKIESSSVKKNKKPKTHRRPDPGSRR